MKRFFTLLIGLIAIVGTAGAFNDNIFFSSDANNWGQGDGNSHKFTKIDDNEFVTELTTSELNTLKTTDIKFKFWVSDWNCGVGAYGTDNVNVSTTKYSSSNGAANAGYFIISKNANAVRVQIRLKYQDNTWNITACVLVSDDTYSIKFDKSIENSSSSWSNVYCYSYIDDHAFVSWTGLEMTSNGNVYSCAIPTMANHVIFNNGGYGEGNQSWSISDITNNGVYKYSGLYGISTTMSSVGMGTFSCDHALNFDGTGVSAYAITGETGGVLTKSDALTNVPANMGLYVEGTGGTYTIPVIADASYSGINWMIAGTDVSVPQTITGYTNYILTNKKADGTTADSPKFFKINSAGNVVPKGKAYLQVPDEYASAHESLWFGDDETTDIKAIKNGQITIDNNAPIYNLAGQRVANGYKGVVIQNGKKLVIK